MIVPALLAGYPWKMKRSSGSISWFKKGLWHCPSWNMHHDSFMENWVQNYLTDWEQLVSVNGLPDIVPALSGVSQGLLSGPLLYIFDLYMLMEWKMSAFLLEVTLFCTLVTCFLSSQFQNPVTIYLQLQVDINTIAGWVDAIYLQFNVQVQGYENLYTARGQVFHLHYWYIYTTT